MRKISATSTNTYKSCRRKFYYYRTEKFQKSIPFNFGLGFEYGLEMWIKHKSIQQAVQYAIQKFMNGTEIYSIAYEELEMKEILRGGNPKDMIVKEYLAWEVLKTVNEHIDLMKDMIPRLINFIIDNKINIKLMQLTSVATLPNGNKNEGRFDGICEWNGKNYIFELKSYAVLKNKSELQHDNQLLNYVNILTRKGEDIEGVLFCQVKKSIPEEPRLIKKGKELSTDKSQKCRAEDYYNIACEMYGEDNIPKNVLDTYIELLNKKDWIECVEVKFSQYELDNHWKQMEYLSEEIDNVIKIIENDKDAIYKMYPNYSTDCSWCSYRLKCQSLDKGVCCTD